MGSRFIFDSSDKAFLRIMVNFHFVANLRADSHSTRFIWIGNGLYLEWGVCLAVTDKTIA